MLVFVSDLHFVDETAGKHNIATEAFRIFFQDIITGNHDRLCNKYPKLRKTIHKALKITQSFERQEEGGWTK